MTALEARDWLTGIDGIGKKTASVLLLFCFGLPLCRSTATSSGSCSGSALLPPKAIDDLAHEIALGALAPDAYTRPT